MRPTAAMRPVLAEDVRALDDVDPPERRAAQRRPAPAGVDELREVADEQPRPEVAPSSRAARSEASAARGRARAAASTASS